MTGRRIEGHEAKPHQSSRWGRDPPRASRVVRQLRFCRLDSENRTRIVIGEQVEQSIRTLPHVTDPLSETLQQVLAANGLPLFVEHVSFESRATS